MDQLFSKFWWSFVVRGVVAVLFGLILILWSGLSLDLLVLTFGFLLSSKGYFPLHLVLANLAEESISF